MDKEKMTTCVNELTDPHVLKNVCLPSDGQETSVDASPQISGHVQFVFPDEILCKLFSYLSLRDRFRLRSMNAQWRRCAFFILPKLKLELSRLFDKITMTVNDDRSPRDFRAFDVVTSIGLLEQFQRSRIGQLTIRLYGDSFNEELLSLMTDMAKNAETVHVHYIGERSSRVCFPFFSSWDDFYFLCTMLGPYITELSFSTDDDMTRFSADKFHDHLACLRKLKTVRLQALSLLVPFCGMVPDDCFQQLEEVEILDLCFSDSCLRTSWLGFVDRFQNQVRKLSVSGNEGMASTQEVELLVEIRRFVRLEHLVLCSTRRNHYQLWHVISLLRHLATACPRLTTLELSWIEEDSDLDDITDLIEAICKIEQLQTVTLDLEFQLLVMCDELSILLLLRDVAAAKDVRRDLRVANADYPEWSPVFHLSGAIGLVLPNNAPKQVQRMNIRERCKTYYI